MDTAVFIPDNAVFCRYTPLNGILPCQWCFSVGVVISNTPLLDFLEDWHDLLHLIEAGLNPGRKTIIVHEVQVLCDLLKSRAGDVG